MLNERPGAKYHSVARGGPTSSEIAPNIAEIGPTWAEAVLNLADSGHVLTAFGRSFSNNGRTQAKFSPIRSVDKVHPVSARFATEWTAFARFGASVEFGRIRESANIGPNRPGIGRILTDVCPISADSGVISVKCGRPKCGHLRYSGALLVQCRVDGSEPLRRRSGLSHSSSLTV